MIGFSEDLKLFRKENLEGVDTKRLQKHELYELVNTDYMLPPLNSKNLTRDYLLQVKDGEVFRVTNEEFKHFEYRLSPWPLLSCSYSRLARLAHIYFCCWLAFQALACFFPRHRL